eukprot:gene22300-biopygen19242
MDRGPEDTEMDATYKHQQLRRRWQRTLKQSHSKRHIISDDSQSSPWDELGDMGLPMSEEYSGSARAVSLAYTAIPRTVVGVPNVGLPRVIQLAIKSSPGTCSFAHTNRRKGWGAKPRACPEAQKSSVSNNVALSPAKSLHRPQWILHVQRNSTPGRASIVCSPRLHLPACLKLHNITRSDSRVDSGPETSPGPSPQVSVQMVHV